MVKEIKEKSAVNLDRKRVFGQLTQCYTELITT